MEWLRKEPASSLRDGAMSKSTLYFLHISRAHGRSIGCKIWKRRLSSKQKEETCSQMHMWTGDTWPSIEDRKGRLSSSLLNVLCQYHQGKPGIAKCGHRGRMVQQRQQQKPRGKFSFRQLWDFISSAAPVLPNAVALMAPSWCHTSNKCSVHCGYQPYLVLMQLL